MKVATCLFRCVFISCLLVLSLQSWAQVKIHMVGNFLGEGPLGCEVFKRLADAHYQVEFVGTRKEQIPQNANLNSNGVVPNVYHDLYDSVSIHQANKNMTRWLNSIPTPDISILHLGANDISAIVAGSSATSMFENLEAYEQVISQIRNHNPNTTIYLSKIITAKSINTSHNMVVDAWNDEMDSLAAKLSSSESRIKVIDFSSDLNDADFKTHFDLNSQGLTKTAEKLSQTLILDAMGPTSREEATISFRIYPQPARTQLNITTVSGQEPSHLKMYDSQGRLVLYAEQTATCDVSSFNEGFYSLLFMIGNRQFAKTVWVQ